MKKLNISFNNIKSTFILKQIFAYITENKLLKLIKYNKQNQNRLNLNINSYKEFGKLKIELIPAKNKYDKFINILNKKDELYYHIYLNDDKKEL